MSVLETEMHPLQALEAAEKEYCGGNYRKGCRFLWRATEVTFKMLAEAHGLDSTDLYAVAEDLDAKLILSNRKHHYLGGLISGKLAKDHYEMDVLEIYDIEGLHRTIPRFVREYLSELDGNDASQ